MLSKAVRLPNSRWIGLTPRHKNAGETVEDVVNRVMKTVGCSDMMMKELMLQGTFLPAGRTLKTALPEKGVMPNCTVLEPDLALIKVHMKETTGVGVNLDDVRDPVRMMEEMGRLAEADETGRKPGMMVTLDWKHAKIDSFLECKRNITLGSTLNNMNCSVLVRRNEWVEFRRSEAFQLAVEGAFACGDPGILIQDEKETAKATSPCGELWLQRSEVCNLGNINVNHFLHGSKWMKEEFEECVYMSLRFLDRVRENFVYVTSESRDVSEREKRLGLGVMGFADLLMRVQVKYGSEDSVRIARAVGSQMQEAAKRFKGETDLQRKVLTLAPTGGTSLITGASFSIEPYFRDVEKLSAQDHVAIQSAWQENVDNGVSKTVNLSQESGRDVIARVFDMAYETKCKGITVFRDGCRNVQPIQMK